VQILSAELLFWSSAASATLPVTTQRLLTPPFLSILSLSPIFLMVLKRMELNENRGCGVGSLHHEDVHLLPALDLLDDAE
jgi:hypothetical protein